MCPETLLGESGPRLHGQVGSNGGKEEGRLWAAWVLMSTAEWLLLIRTSSLSGKNRVLLADEGESSPPPVPPSPPPLSGHGRRDQRRRLTLLLDREAQSGGSHEAEPWPWKESAQGPGHRAWATEGGAVSVFR